MRRLSPTRLTVLALAAGLSASAATVLSPAAPVAAATVPAGFSDSAIAPFSNPVAVEWLPGDKVVVLEQGGRVRIGDPNGPFSTALTIANICAGGERGLLGFTHDPAFLSNGLVYVYYTRDAPGFPGSCVNRVSRFTMSGTTIDPASEVVLIDHISSVNGNHNGGDIDFGSDGFLYVAIGDAGTDPRADSVGANDAAQDLSLLNGKILRVTRDGQPAPGNPFSGAGSEPCAFRGNLPSTPTTPCQEIFAFGLRNPYRFAFDRNDGSSRFFINDVGGITHEEVDFGQIGANYGWPIREGGCPRGDTVPCPGPGAGHTDPIAFYGRTYGNVITAGAFVPQGAWPALYDGAYFFADGGSGRMWVRFADGSLNLDAPFATGAFGIADMTFGYDADGRAVVYYVQTGGGLRKISPTTPPSTSARANMRLVTVTPSRAYDTGAPGIPAIGVAAGDVFNGTTRRVDLNPPGDYEAALVNVTYDGTDGAGFLRFWATRGLRPKTSSVNADSAGALGANAAIVPLDSDGTFILEATFTGRVVVDVMAWFDTTAGAVTGGRFDSLPPLRLVDTRQPANQPLSSGSTNRFSRTSDDVVFTATGQLGVPADGTASAIVVSVAAISNGAPGFVGAYPTGTTWQGTSNANVTPGDTRANLVVVPIGANGQVSLRTVGVGDVVVDVLGYVTSSSASASTAGLYSSIEPARVVDTRTPVGFGPLTPLQVSSITMPTPGSAVVQNVTVVTPSAPGFVSTFPAGGAEPEVSTLNFAGNQIRAALAFTDMPASRSISYKSLVDTNIVVDVIGTWS